MTEQELELQPEQEQEESAADIINELRANSVPKDKYNRLVEENRKLMKSLANGEQIEVKAPEKPDIAELDRALYTDDVQHLTDLEMISKTLQLRQALIDETGEDIFIPVGKRFAPEDSDIATAEKVADVFQQCVDAAEGDSRKFIRLLDDRTIDVPMPKKRRK